MNHRVVRTKLCQDLEEFLIIFEDNVQESNVLIDNNLLVSSTAHKFQAIYKFYISY